MDIPTGVHASAAATIQLEVRWHGQPYSVEVPATATVSEVKQRLEELTGVAPHAQKLIGLLPRGRQPPDHAALGELGVKSGQRCMLVGIEAARAAQLASEEEEHRARAAAEAERAKVLAEVEEARRAEEQLRYEAEEAQRRQERIRRQEQSAMEREEMRRQQEENQRLRREAESSLEIGRLQCFSSAVGGNPRLDRGDKVVLPAAVLEEAVHKGLPFPYTFRVRKVDAESPADADASPIAHCGALDFEAPAGMCYLPASIMAKLALQEGDHVSLKSVRLPKGEYAQLQPQSASWIDIPMATREAILADQLRNYQTLTVGDTVRLSHGSQDHRFHVTKVLPAPSHEMRDDSADAQLAVPAPDSLIGGPSAGISIIDADVAVDVIEPREAYSPIAPVTLDGSTAGELGQGESVTYRLRLDRPLDAGLLIEVSPVGVGDVDLYVSHTPENRRPTPLAYTWKAQTQGAKRLHIEAADPQLARAVQEGWLYITVCAYATPSGASVSFSLECKPGGGEGRQLVLESPDKQADVVHRREVPVTSYGLHEMACARYSWRCEECGAVLPLAEKDKHRAVAHVVVHREFECPKRMVGCLYCSLEVPFDQRGEHQGVCGNRTVTCSLCHTRHKRNGIKKHLVEEHGVYPQHANTDYFAE
ncbi:ubiquitin domain containing protein [Acanthamoeba castellanii str. Neff]|uniref:Ubiquitin domain containing protein n=1 Tax=Acanthamoeba castellanii (strain ATCC 30010 / Neff) TaxID=1257118 RepID=L8GTE8_ACACF|nr:ubiquitin domain containing protein [Acanthamoeba castellanii str. Neff]ELR16182.1 ubiquitin domain containing protein [Acanthamoeba castellanii str. Neff]